uniref:Uncharacterized protein n=1 Tax=Brassica oleracea var. oleracea TaxID=109376 RepID=A0A0D3ADL4_BRAOL
MKSKFWYFLRKLKKVKKTNGQDACRQVLIFEKNQELRYQSRTGYDNMYKKFREVPLHSDH